MKGFNKEEFLMELAKNFVGAALGTVGTIMVEKGLPKLIDAVSKKPEKKGASQDLHDKLDEEVDGMEVVDIIKVVREKES